MDRRKFLVNSATLAAGSYLTVKLPLEDQPERKRELKVAFLTDIHVKPDQTAERGMRQAFKHVNELKHKPDFIINGGDAIMDAMGADREKTKAQWNVWQQILKEENKLPLYHVIGNHDAWGWQVKDESIKTDPLYNKGWVMQIHEMQSPYYSFTKGAWKFIVLDSAHENNGGYISRVDEAQYQWLELELKNTDPSMHVAILSHIPIVSFCAAMFTDENQPNGDWRISRALLHTDSRKLTSLFSKYSNIKCCLSGHIHLQDKVEYKGIQYFCNGAVSGNWWKGAFKGFEPAYALFTFGNNGSVKREMINY